MSSLIDMTPGNCTINYDILYHTLMQYSPYFTIWFYLYSMFFVFEQGASLSHHHFAVIHHQFWNVVLQIYLCILYRPVAHLPMFGFQIGGVTKSWGLNAIELWIFWVWLMFAVFLSIVHMFYARVYMISKMIVLNKYRALVNASGVVFVLAVLVALTCGSSILLVFLSTPFVVQIKTNAFLKYNSRIIFCPDFAIVDLSMWQTILPNALAALGLTILFLFMIFLSTASLFVLSTKSSTSSVKTLRTQKELMKSFMIQVVTHTLFLFTPFAGCVLMAVFGKLDNVAIYTAIFSLAHQGVLTILIYAIFTPTTKKWSKKVVRFVNWLFSCSKWMMMCGCWKKKPLPRLIHVKAVRKLTVVNQFTATQTF